MMDRFGAYVAGLNSRAFSMGKTDCMTVVCDWIRDQTGIDPMEDLRGLYRTPYECEVATRDAAGLDLGFMRDPVGVCAPRFEKAGLVAVSHHSRGDIGLVEIDGQSVGALCTGQYWVAVAPEGATSFTPDRILGVWRLPDA